MKTGVTKKEMTPHQPATRLTAVYRTQYLRMHFLQSSPSIVLVDREYSIPMFWRIETTRVVAICLHIWQ
jgi:hypothetical protein